MIPKAKLLEFAAQYKLQPTTVEKDYVLGWLLAAISQHDVLSKWVFKGGTCLKKCYFETYRFSEDLDFTIPRDAEISSAGIKATLHDIAQWVEARTGLQFPRERCEVEEYDNPRGNKSYQAKMTYVGPLNLSRGSLQRVKFDLTQDELLADATDSRELFHPYGDQGTPLPRVRCYSVNEILAEKSRALFEREGRSRDVYDIIHLSQDFREAIDPRRAADLAARKFEFKGLPGPTVDLILARVDPATLRTDWEQQLRHQVPHLPDVEEFLRELRGALAWWLQPELAPLQLAPISRDRDEVPVPKQYFPSIGAVAPGQVRGGALEQVRIAARNRLCAEIVYHGVVRLIEPYSLRHPRTGNRLLYGFELTRNGVPSKTIKAYKVAELSSARATDRPFSPRFLVEL
jgi:predicted nucleotidyltransferase component of viral defense system